MSEEFIGLRNDDATIEYNARFILGNERAESLESSKWYTFKELQPDIFFDTCAQNKDKKHKWRKIGIND